MSDNKSVDKQQKPAISQERRDAEIYVAIGIFVVAVGLPVLIGTIWATSRPSAAVINFVCGVVLLLVGISSMAYGWMLLKKERAKH